MMRAPRPWFLAAAVVFVVGLAAIYGAALRHEVPDSVDVVLLEEWKMTPIWGPPLVFIESGDFGLVKGVPYEVTLSYDFHIQGTGWFKLTAWVVNDQTIEAGSTAASGSPLGYNVQAVKWPQPTGVVTDDLAVRLEIERFRFPDAPSDDLQVHFASVSLLFEPLQRDSNRDGIEDWRQWYFPVPAYLLPLLVASILAAVGTWYSRRVP